MLQFFYRNFYDRMEKVDINVKMLYNYIDGVCLFYKILYK